MCGVLVFGESNVQGIESFVSTTNFKKILVAHLPKKKNEFCRLFEDLLKQALEIGDPEIMKKYPNGLNHQELKPKDNGGFIDTKSKISAQEKLDRQKFKKTKEMSAAQKEPCVEIKTPKDITSKPEPATIGNVYGVAADDDSESID